MMETIKKLVDIFLHIDKNLAMVTNQYGFLTYGILFLVVFMGAGSIVTGKQIGRAHV